MIIINTWIIINCSFFSDTFGVQSVSITDSSNGRVCIECVFSLYSTDTGCTVELISSSIIQYTDTFTRPLSDNTATGCISNITTGLYTIRVYDQNSTIVAVETTGVNVTEQVIPSVTTSTTPATMTTSPITTETTTTPPTDPPVECGGSSGQYTLYHNTVYLISDVYTVNAIMLFFCSIV